MRGGSGVITRVVPSPFKKLLPHYTRGCEKLLVKTFAALGGKQSTLPVGVDCPVLCGAAWQPLHKANGCCCARWNSSWHMGSPSQAICLRIKYNFCVRWLWDTVEMIDTAGVLHSRGTVVGYVLWGAVQVLWR